MLGDKTNRKPPGRAETGDSGVAPDDSAQAHGRAPDGPAFESSQLFGDHKQISIEHNGFRYVLRITRLGKLVLNK